MRARYLHLLLVLSVLLMVFGWESSAQAGAPYCDPEAFTGSAPSPILGVPDIRLEQDDSMYWAGCEKIASVLQGSEPQDDQSNASGTSQTEHALPVVLIWVFKPVSSRILTEIARTRGPNGYPREVFRPPRRGQ
jgi:hypothetical protein